MTKILKPDELMVGMVVDYSDHSTAGGGLQYLVIENTRNDGKNLALMFFGKGWSRVIPGNAPGTCSIDEDDEFVLIADLWKVYEEAQEKSREEE